MYPPVKLKQFANSLPHPLKQFQQNIRLKDSKQGT